MKPDWRDPNMPVHRRYRYADGRVVEDVPPEVESAIANHRLDVADPFQCPDWRNDPTYNLRRKRNRV